MGVLSGNFAAMVPAITGQWLRLDIDPPPEGNIQVTKKQLAELLDTIFGQNHCDGNPVKITAPEQKQILAAVDCQALADKLGTGQLCGLGRRLGQPIIKKVYAHWSDLEVARNYQLKSTTGIILSGPVETAATILVQIVFGATNYAPFDYYVDPDRLPNPPKYNWIGNVVDGQGAIVAGPGIVLKNGAVYLPGLYSGTLEIELPVKYHTWTVSIPGVFVGKKRSYETDVLGFWQGGLETLVIKDELEDQDSEQDCACGGSALPYPDSSIVLPDGNVMLPNGSKDLTIQEPEPVPDPKYGCRGDITVTCCDGQEVTGCSQNVSQWGGQDLPQSMIEAYPPGTNFVGLLPEKGYCGDLTVDAKDPDCVDCDAVDPIQVDTDNTAEVIAPSSSAMICVIGGGKKTVTVDGSGFWLDAAYSKTSMDIQSNCFYIYADSTACGSAEIKIDDGCTNVLVYLRSTLGQWVLTSTVPSSRPCGQTAVGVCISGNTMIGDVWSALRYYPDCYFMEDKDISTCGDYNLGNPGTSKVWCYICERRYYKWEC